MIAWLKPFGYEIDIDDVSAKITTLLNEEIDAKDEPFGKYEEERDRITMDIKIACSKKNRNKMIEDLEEKLGIQTKGKEPLILTWCLGKNQDNDSGVEEEDVSAEK